MRNDAIFITGTGTGVGKTWISAALAAGLVQKKESVAYWKPIETGVASGAESSDAEVVSRGEPRTAIIPTLKSYPLAASPDQAARAAGDRGVDAREIARRFGQVRPADAVTLVEGAGGVLVPLNHDGDSWIDVMRATGLPTLVVATSALGTLNHTLLTLAALDAAGIDVLGVVVAGVHHPDNAASLRRMAPDVEFIEYDAAVDQPEVLATWLLDRLDELRATDDWERIDRDHVWHPYTQHATSPVPLSIARAAGSYLELTDGRTLLDGASAWWVNTIGHGRREIGAAIHRQQSTLDHVLFAGATHRPAAELARTLLRFVDGSSLSRIFYSDNGSTAIEIALKMVYQRWANAGEPERRLFVSFSGSYHGDTFGAMSAAAKGGFHATFSRFFFETLRAPIVTRHASVHCPEGGCGLESRLDAFDEILRSRRNEIAGVILEPLVQGAGGMLMQPESFVRGIAQRCKAQRIPLILDEVLTGLGRIGARFAFERAGVDPDIVCAAKGLTGGNLPLAVTMAREEFFDACLAHDKSRALLHGHSYTANPIACAAATQALGIVEREDLPRRALDLESQFNDWIAHNAANLALVAPRALGGILAFENPGTAGADYFHRQASTIPGRALERGLFLRPLGNTTYFMPPLTISDDELAEGLAALRDATQAATSPSS